MKKLFLSLALLGIFTCSLAWAYRPSTNGTLENADTKVQEETVTVVSRYSVPYTVNELIERSTIVVKGTVEEISSPFTVRGVGNIGELQYTDYTISISEIARGENTDLSSVVVRMEGNPADGTIIYEDAPILEIGKEYLLFLQKPGVGGGFNTEGEYYYIIGSRQGVYEKSEGMATFSAQDNEEVYISQQVLLVMEESEEGIPEIHRRNIKSVSIGNEDSDSVLQWSSFAERVKKAEEYMPVDEQYNRKELEKNCRINLDNGMITEEEYEMAIRMLDQFAEIVE